MRIELQLESLRIAYELFNSPNTSSNTRNRLPMNRISKHACVLAFEVLTRVTIYSATKRDEICLLFKPTARLSL